jgi:hypothetical protein
LIRAKAQIEKNKGKLVQLEIGKESNREKLEEAEEKIKVLQDRVLKLELEQRPEFEKLRNSASPALSVGSLELDQMVAMEEDTVQKKYEQARKKDPSVLFSPIDLRLWSFVGH